MTAGGLVDVAGTRLWVEQRGDADAFPLLVLHGGPGLDHHEFADYLDPLSADGTYRLVLVDQRAQGRSDRDVDPATWTLPRMAADVTDLAAALDLPSYAVLGHSFGAFVALRHAVDAPGAARATIVSGGVASGGWLSLVAGELERFEPVELRQQVADSWAAESTVSTDEEAARVADAQMPFHFRDPLDPRIEDYVRRTADQQCSAAMLRHFATVEESEVDVLDRLGDVKQPVLVLSGRHDRVCPVGAGEQMAAAIREARLVVFENSAHMFFVEEQDRYLTVVREFLDRTLR